MHIFLLGATGPSGLVFLDEALKTGYEVTIYARTTSKLPPDTATNPKVHIVQGEFTDLEATKEALSYGAQVLVSFAGPSVPNKGTPVSEFYRTILFPLVATEGKIKRALITSTASYSAPGDTFSLKFWFGTTMLKWLAGSAYYEINGMSKAVIDLLPVDEVAWTMFRVPVLTNGEVAPVQAGHIGSGKDKFLLSRKSMCIWVLNEIEEKKWVGRAPAISNPGWF